MYRLVINSILPYVDGTHTPKIVANCSAFYDADLLVEKEAVVEVAYYDPQIPLDQWIMGMVTNDRQLNEAALRQRKAEVDAEKAAQAEAEAAATLANSIVGELPFVVNLPYTDEVQNA